jgi:LmbE family N-acetylglucosaminyl deacetylase
MLKFEFSKDKDRPLKILCLAAHSDDIEIGCGGSLLRLLECCNDVHVDWVVLGSNGERTVEAQKSAERFLGKARSKNIIIKGFKDSFFPYVGAEIKSYFEELKSFGSPDIIFTHFRHDLHQDHRLISELTWNTWRNHLILEYEIVKYDGDLGSPNFFIHLSKDVCNKKIDIILKSFNTQLHRDWFTRDAFLAIMRIRGIESRSPEGFAEGFYCRKAVL